MALINYMSQILVELVKLANLIITVTKAVACGNRIENVLKITPEMENGKNSAILSVVPAGRLVPCGGIFTCVSYL